MANKKVLKRTISVIKLHEAAKSAVSLKGSGAWEQYLNNYGKKEFEKVEEYVKEFKKYIESKGLNFINILTSNDWEKYDETINILEQARVSAQNKYLNIENYNPNDKRKIDYALENSVLKASKVLGDLDQNYLVSISSFTQPFQLTVIQSYQPAQPVDQSAEQSSEKVGGKNNKELENGGKNMDSKKKGIIGKVAIGTAGLLVGAGIAGGTVYGVLNNKVEDLEEANAQYVQVIDDYNNYRATEENELLAFKNSVDAAASDGLTITEYESLYDTIDVQYSANDKLDEYGWSSTEAMENYLNAIMYNNVLDSVSNAYEAIYGEGSSDGKDYSEMINAIASSGSSSESSDSSSSSESNDYSEVFEAIGVLYGNVTGNEATEDYVGMLSEVGSAYTTATELIGSLNDQVKSLNDQVISTQEQLDELYAAIDEVLGLEDGTSTSEYTVDEIKKALEDNVSSLNTTIASLNTTIASLNKTIASLQAQINGSSGSESEDTTDLTELQAKVDYLQDQVDYLQDQLDYANEQITSLETEKSNLETEKSNLETEKSNLETTLDELYTAIDEFLGLEDGTSTSEYTADEIKNALNEKLNDALNTATYYQNLYNSKVSDYNKLLDDYKKLQSSSDTSDTTDTTELQKQIDALEDEIGKYETTISQVYEYLALLPGFSNSVTITGDLAEDIKAYLIAIDALSENEKIDESNIYGG